MEIDKSRTIKSYRDLVVWQKAMNLTEEIYSICKELPTDERFGIMSQLQRAAVSIPSNIAEGCQRNNRGEFKHFCGIAFGSTAELETQLLIIKRVYKVDSTFAFELLSEVQKMLRQLIRRLDSTNH